MSSHGLNIEAGRYGAKYQSKHNRCCPTCTDLETLEHILEIPIIEEELQVYDAIFITQSLIIADH